LGEALPASVYAALLDRQEDAGAQPSENPRALPEKGVPKRRNQVMISNNKREKGGESKA